MTHHRVNWRPHPIHNIIFQRFIEEKTEEINSKTSVIRFREKVSRNSKNFTLRIQQVNEKNFSLLLWFLKFFCKIRAMGHGKVDYYISTLCKDACDHTSLDC